MTLIRGDHGEIEPSDLRDSLRPDTGFDFTQEGRPYAGSPDDWRPFDKDQTIAAYFGTELTPVFLSSFVRSNDISVILERTDLYIIDPLCLMHPTLHEILKELQSAIFVSKRYFCIVLPQSIADPLRSQLIEASTRQLSMLQKAYARGEPCEVEVETDRRLKGYLARVSRLLDHDGADPEMNRKVTAFLGTRVRDPGIHSAPRMRGR